MASLKDAQKLTQRAKQQANALHGALTDDELDFRRIVQLADELGQSADRIAATFETIDDAFTGTLEGESPSSEGEQEAGQGEQEEEEAAAADDEDGADGANGSGPELEGGDSVTRQELLEMAKVAGIRRRTTMSKEELATALERAAARAGEQ